MPTRLLRCLLLSIHVSAIATACAQGATEPSPQEQLNKLLASPLLLLSSEVADRRPTFGVTWHVLRDSADVGGVDVLVESGPAGAAALVREEGRAYAYATDGLFVTLDANHPGTLLIATDGHFEFVARMDETVKTMHLGIQFTALPGTSRIVVDFRSLLAPMAAHPGRIERDERTGLLSARFDAATLSVQPDPQPAAPYPLKSLTVNSQRIGRQTLRDPWLNRPPQASILGLTLARLESWPLAKKSVGPRDAGFRVPLPLPPRGFWTVAANRAAGEQLAALVLGKPPPATAPTPRAHPAYGLFRAHVLAELDSFQRAAESLTLTPRQAAEIKAMFAIRRAAFEEAMDRLPAPAEAPGAAEQAMRDALGVMRDLRQWLDDAEFLRFLEAHLADGRTRPDADPTSRVIGTLGAALARVQMPDATRLDAVELLWKAQTALRHSRGQLAAGDVTEEQARQRTRDLGARLDDDLRRVLGEELYRRLEAEVLAQTDSAPRPPR